MPLPVDRIKMTVFGSIDTSQGWSTSINFIAELAGGSWGPSDATALATALDAGAVNAWWLTAKAAASTTTTHDGTRLLFYPAGSETATVIGEHILPTAQVGTGTGNNPRLIAMVASLRSDVAGRSGRGRSYFPATGMAVNTNGQWTTGNCGLVGGAYVTLLNSMNALDVSGYGLTKLTAAIASFTKSQMNDITSVVCNSLPDTQHRREDKLGAAFTYTGAVT